MSDTTVVCEAVKDRATLTEAIQRACHPTGELSMFRDLPADGSERALAVSFSILHGIVAEYFDGGDQMTENCTCGEHEDQVRVIDSPATKYFKGNDHASS
jgi:hypothetical protein